MKRLVVAIALTLGSTPTFVASGAQRTAPEAKIAIFVGPQSRDGFTDVDSGILESIKDIQDELRRSSQFTVARTSDEATLTLLVVARRTPGTTPGAGIAVGTVYFPTTIHRRTIDTILRMGTYEKATTSESPEGNERWSAAAKTVVKDVTAWVEANRSALAKR